VTITHLVFYVDQALPSKTPGTTRAKFTILLTYDPLRKKYRQWAFVSDGRIRSGSFWFDLQANGLTALSPGQGARATPPWVLDQITLQAGLRAKRCQPFRLKCNS